MLGLWGASVKTQPAAPSSAVTKASKRQLGPNMRLPDPEAAGCVSADPGSSWVRALALPKTGCVSAGCVSAPSGTAVQVLDRPWHQLRETQPAESEGVEFVTTQELRSLQEAHEAASAHRHKKQRQRLDSSGRSAESESCTASGSVTSFEYVYTGKWFLSRTEDLTEGITF